MTYRDNVEQAATALVGGDAMNWELARLTFENTWNHGEPRQPDRVSMEEWCADVRARCPGKEFTRTTGILFKATWRSVIDRNSDQLPSFAETYTEVCRRPERTVEPAAASAECSVPLTYEELREHIEVASDEAKQYAFRRLASEPAVIMEALAPGSPIANAVANLEHRAALHQRQRYQEVSERDPIARHLDQGQASAELLSLCIQHARASERFAGQVAQLLPRSGALGADRLFWIQQAVDRLRGVLDQLDTYLATGQTDLDAFVQGVLSGE